MSLLRNVVVSTIVATAGTVIALAIIGKKETGSAAAAFNATSHMVHGEDMADVDGIDLAHTGTGVVLHASAMLGWAALQEWFVGRWVRRGGPERALLAGTATSAVAYVVDYHVVPPRFTPGMEKRVSKGAIGTMYAVLAAMLAIGVRKGR